MKKAIIGKKVGMTQIFDETGKVIPVTVIEAGPCPVVQKKTADNDGYESVQLGFEDVKTKNVNKPQKGHFDKADVAPKRNLKEFRLDDISAYNLGDLVKADTFEVGDVVDVTGTSKGKGFQGAIKRHGFSMLKASHGTGPNRRTQGAMSAGTDPAKIRKGRKMPGHMGAETVTVQNLEVVKIDAENNLIAIKGAIPGPKKGIVYIIDSVKKA